MRYFLNTIFIGLIIAGANPAKGDSIQITNVRSDRKSGSKMATYTVAIRYTLESHAKGTIQLGFNVDAPLLYKTVAKKDVPRGEGAFEVIANVEDAGHTVMNARVALYGVDPPERNALWSYVTLAAAIHAVQLRHVDTGMQSLGLTKIFSESKNMTDDAVSISSVSCCRFPDSKFWTYRVSAQYRLASIENANLAFSFDIDNPGIYVQVENKKIGKGEGVVEVLMDFPKPITVVYLTMNDEQTSERSKALALSQCLVLAPEALTKAR